LNTKFIFIFGTFRESLIDFYTSSGKRKPDHIIIFRFEVLGLLFAYITKSFFWKLKNIEKYGTFFTGMDY
jgi:hypothetical protein